LQFKNLQIATAPQWFKVLQRNKSCSTIFRSIQNTIQTCKFDFLKSKLADGRYF